MYEAMAREFALREKHLREPFAMVSRAEQTKEIGTGRYFGGVKIEESRRAFIPVFTTRACSMRRGPPVSSFAAHTPVLRIGRDGAGFIVQTPASACRGAGRYRCHERLFRQCVSMAQAPGDAV